jgi:hypothetical protein
VTICTACGKALIVGDWPYCPHGTAANVVIEDSIPGGFVQEHFGHAPEVFYSKKTMALRAKELGLEPMVRNAGPLDKHVPRWVTTDPQTMANAEALIARVHG